MQQKASAGLKGPRERIREAALVLFYREGLGVPLERIMEESGTYKKSLYHHFPLRADLGREYLHMQAERFVGLLSALTRKHRRFLEFWQAWVRVLRSRVRSGRYRGCPFACLAGQSLAESSEYSAVLRSAMERWTAVLARYLETALVGEGERPLHPQVARALAEQVLVSFEGATALHLVTGDAQHFRTMEKNVPLLLEALRRQEEGAVRSRA